MTALLLALLTVGAAPDTLELSLAEAIELALGQSPVATEAAAARTQGVSTLVRGATNLLPSVNASLGYGKSEYGSNLLPESLRFYGTWSWNGNLTINQVVFDPAVFAGLASSVLYSGYYATDARDKQARLIYDATADYLGMLKAELLHDAADKALRRTAENLKLVREKKGLGSASRIDLMRSEVQQAQAEIELLSAEKTVAVAAENFRATVGIDDRTPVRPTERLDAPAGFEIGDPDSLLEEITRLNPGARLVARSGTIAGWNTAAAIGKALPSINAYWTSSYTDTLFPSNPSRWDDRDNISYGIRATFPLLDLKSYVLNVVDAVNESRRTRAAARRTELQIRSAAAAAIHGYLEARQRYEYAERNLELNRELHALAGEQHRLGTISLLDFFSVDANLAAAEASHISALSDTYIQAAQISYLLGIAEASARPADKED